jgi:GNAT superfamily N-acetyltransferase
VTSRVRVRVATAADADLLADLGSRTLRESLGPEKSDAQASYISTTFHPGIKSGDLADPQATFLVAEADGVAVAYARLRFGYSPPEVQATAPMEIARFYTDAPWIGRGVGSTLMETCLEVAREKGCDAVWLDVWEKNHRAIAFYEKWGFAVTGGRASGWATMARSV